MRIIERLDLIQNKIITESSKSIDISKTMKEIMNNENTNYTKNSDSVIQSLVNSKVRDSHSWTIIMCYWIISKLAYYVMKIHYVHTN